MIKIMLQSTYGDMVRLQSKLLTEKGRIAREHIELYGRIDSLNQTIEEKNIEIYELQKVCQCRECKWYAENQVCVNGDSDNRAEFMNPYGSCEKCERR
ncbi:MAG: hypothetical protein LLG05_18930 [Porphyromonadaceae bacterium]|nr:hypothetical protein [Porphyromonadaceae bacterium]